MKKSLKAKRPDSQDAYPSPSDVERMCQEIQSHWSARDRRRRTVAIPAHWSAPTIKLAEISREKISHWAMSIH
jgi:hypothetical protein